MIARSRSQDPTLVDVETILVVESDTETRITVAFRRTVSDTAMLLAAAVIDIAGSTRR